MSKINERLSYKTLWTIEKFKSDKDYKEGNSYATDVAEGNLLLNEGITELLKLLVGDTADAYSNANARLGVGNSSTAASASDTGLLGGSTAFKAMEATFPQVSAQTVTFKSVFGSADANFDWEEFTVDNGSTPNDNLNRKVESKGTKSSGETWTLTLTITIS